MNESRKKLYDEWRETYKDDPAKAVGWRNKDALHARFKSTISHLTPPESAITILDYGCGVSLNLLRYLPPEWDYRYVGVDCNEESLSSASEKYNIPITEYYDPTLRYQLINDEYLTHLGGIHSKIIVVQGVYQEFDSISSIRDNVYKLSELLAPGGQLLIMTPSNRLLDAEGKSVLKISAYDAVSILEYVGLPYEIYLGELGEHIIMKIWKRG